MASAAIGKVYLIPSFIDEANLQPLPAYILDAVKECQVFFVENERSARRYLKQLWKEMVIDACEWHTIHKAEAEVKDAFKKSLQRGVTIGIISEAGLPRHSRPRSNTGRSGSCHGCSSKATYRPQLHPAGVNGQWHERAALSSLWATCPSTMQNEPNY